MNVHSTDKKRTINIAFALMGGETWTFGEVYLKDLIKSLKKYGPIKFTYYIVVPHQNQRENLLIDSEAQYLYYEEQNKIFPSNKILKNIYKLLRKIDKKRNNFNDFLTDRKIDIFFGPLIDYPLNGVKTLSWLPDFQHVHFPSMFSTKECEYRDELFKRVAKYSTKIILISNAAKKDFINFSPEFTNKVCIFPPITYIDDSIYNIPLNLIRLKYNLPEKFIFLPNQFWKHKNHTIVFKAIKILKDKGIAITLVCAGNATDNRHPAYFSTLFSEISKWGLRKHIIYIGLIPRIDVLLLIRQSICTINPSLFEGFGYTVDEARSIGKKIILSDIPPHREQNPPKAFFFNPNNVEELVDVINEIWTHTNPGPDFELETSARNEYRIRIQQNVQIFEDIVNETLIQ